MIAGLLLASLISVNAEDITFKPGKGLQIVSEDGDFAMVPRLRVQFRYSADLDSGGMEHGLSIRRARLQFTGHAFGKHNRYKVEFAFSPRDLGFKEGTPTHTPILTWYSEFTYIKHMIFKVGQYKIPFSKQRVISSGNLEMVDRSIANSEFNLDRDIGIEIYTKGFKSKHEDATIRYHAGIYTGEGRDQMSNTNSGLLYLARFEFLPVGVFKDYSEVDFERLKELHISIGLAYGFLDDGMKDKGSRGSAPIDGGTTDFHNFTADLMLKARGFSFFGEFFRRQGTRNYGIGVETDAPRNGLGWMAQLGYLCKRQPVGLTVRYGEVRAKGINTALDDKSELGAALSYYFAEHPLKLQADYFRLFDDRNIMRGISTVRVQLQVAY